MKPGTQVVRLVLKGGVVEPISVPRGILVLVKDYDTVEVAPNGSLMKDQEGTFILYTFKDKRDV